MGSYLELLFSKETEVLLHVLFEGFRTTICDYVPFSLPSLYAVIIFYIFSSYAAYDMVSVEAGHEAVLSCPSASEVSLLMVIWKTKCSTCCLLAYRSDHNETRRLNCSERMTWKYSPESDPALRIYPVNLGDEGNYTCEVVSTAGNFLFFSFLTVIVPPTVSLTFDKSTGAVCQASAGKPAADIFWIPPSNHSTGEEVHHPNGTVTRLSWVNSNLSTVTCLVTHPATNQSLFLDLPQKLIVLSEFLSLVCFFLSLLYFTRIPHSAFGGLTLAGCLMLTKLLYHSPAQRDKGRKIR
uniref:Ig-like domain-containing protein n=1 Tax=Strigops habroptila TaxID=2489341 RepID=A0A672U7I9_STRHB